ncbi:MAG: hypothetical protein A2017_07455 [Lentisphaerae bacterium GWF2_44_16]|nr:MAG: hypothetical protein A2017_07455 [Lentisphaerae bacterium GWF2_44_16]
MIFDEIQFTPRTKVGTPKFLQLANYLEKWIKSHKMADGTKFPSDRQLSRKLGLTTVTVSKSLKELERIGLIARKTGSGTFIASENRVSNSKKTRPLRIGIACHVPITTDWYSTSVVTFFHEYWQGKNCELVSLILSGEDYQRGIEEYHLDGMFIILPLKQYIPNMLRLAEKKFPFVTIGAPFPELASHSLHCDYISPGVKAIKYLYKLGHRKIGYITCDYPSPSALGRLKGYLQGMYEVSLTVNPLWLSATNIFSCEMNFDFEKQLCEMLSDKKRPSALLVHGHVKISSVFDTVKKLKLNIPRDISLIAFDDPYYLEHLNPPVTTFRQPLKEMVELAGKRLDAMITKGEKSPIGIFGPIFIERASCARII